MSPGFGLNEAMPSATPLPRKLGIKPGDRIALLGAPDGFEAALGAVSDGVEVRRALRGAFDVIVAFFADCAALQRRMDALRGALEPAGGLWIAWPKRSSGVSTDLTDSLVRELGLAAGLVDNKVCAIDETWSGLRFVFRLSDRPPSGQRGRPAASGPSGVDRISSA